MMQLDSQFTSSAGAQFDIDESQGEHNSNNDGDFKWFANGGQRKRKA